MLQLEVGRRRCPEAAAGWLVGFLSGGGSQPQTGAGAGGQPNGFVPTDMSKKLKNRLRDPML